MPVLLLFIVFIVVPIVELLLILQVAELLGGGAVGGGLTLGLLIVDSLLGAWLLRNQGRSVWRQLTAELDAGRMPAREVVDGAFVIVGGVLLLTPGFLTDIVGVAMLVPPTRRLFGTWVFGLLTRRVRLAFRIVDTGLQNFPRSTRQRQWDFDAEDVAEDAPDSLTAAPEPPRGDEPDFDFKKRHFNG